MSWFHNEDFWRDTFDFLFPARMERAEDEVACLLELLPQKPATALDLCCGPGRTVAALAQHGIETTGVDISPFLLEHAKERCRVMAVESRLIQDDMLTFREEQAFDLITNLFSSFGYFDSHEDNVQVLRNAEASLKPGGHLLLELNGRENIAKNFEPAGRMLLDDGRVLIDLRTPSDDFTRNHSEWIILDAERQLLARHQFQLWMYASSDLKRMLQQVGFDQVQIFGSLEGEPFGPDSNRTVVLARKSS